MFGRDVEDPNMKEGVPEQRFFNEAAIKDDVSDIGRSRKGSAIEF